MTRMRVQCDVAQCGSHFLGSRRRRWSRCIVLLCLAPVASFGQPAAAQVGAREDQVAADASAGWSAYEAGDLDRAKSLMGRAVKQAPGKPDYQAALGIIEVRAGDSAEGERHLRRAVALQPANAEYRLHLAEVYQQGERDAEALHVLQLAVVDRALRSSWHFTRGFSLFRLGRLKAARVEFKPLINDPQFLAPAQFFLGNIEFSENSFETAADHYAIAVRAGDAATNSAFNVYTYDYGLALFRLARYSEAKKQFEASVARYDKDPLPWMYLGRCEQQLGNYQSAIHMFETSLAVDPSFGLAYYELARLEQKFGDRARAAELFATIAAMKREEINVEERRAGSLKIGGSVRR